MYTLIKGVVRKKTKRKLQIRLVNGKCFWTHINYCMVDTRDFVWVAWDYTHDRPTLVLTKDELHIFMQQPSEDVEFSNPLDEEIINEEVISSADEQWLDDNSIKM